MPARRVAIGTLLSLSVVAPLRPIRKTDALLQYEAKYGAEELPKTLPTLKAMGDAVGLFIVLFSFLHG